MAERTSRPPDRANDRPARARVPVASTIMLPEALVFDFDGTLVDTETAEFEAVRQVWADHGAVYTHDRWQPWVGSLYAVPWIAELTDHIGSPLDERELHLRQRRYNRELLATVLPRPGAAALLEAAAAAGVPVAVASNAPADWVEGHLGRLGLLDHFAAVVTVDRVGRGKPHPEPYLTAVAAVGASPERSVAFEDSLPGLRSALAAGLYSVAIPGPMSSGHDLADADLTVSSLAEVALDDLGRAVDAR